MRLVRYSRPRQIVWKGRSEGMAAEERTSISRIAADCNSNNSAVSSTFSQEVEFIQDTTDDQWFLDEGYRDPGSGSVNGSRCNRQGNRGSNSSLLSSSHSQAGLPELSYDSLAKHLDANLAEIDMETFRSEDIHSILMDLQSNHQGEMFASVSNSLMDRLGLDSSQSYRSTSQGEESGSTDMSICKSEPLFSPVKECPLLPLSVAPMTNFSVDSLDCDPHELMLTCRANKDNYTITFEGSLTQDETDSSEYQGGVSAGSETSGSVWLDRVRRRSSGNNNNSSNENSLSTAFLCFRSQSLPDICQRSNGRTDRQTESNISLLKLFMRQRSMLGNINNHTSAVDNESSLFTLRNLSKDKTATKSVQTESATKQKVYVLFPNYSLPNLEFLQEKECNQIVLVPQKFLPVVYRQQNKTRTRPLSCNDIEQLRKRGLTKDWDSLTMLLPKECRNLITSNVQPKSTILEEAESIPPPKSILRKKRTGAGIREEHRHSLPAYLLRLLEIEESREAKYREVDNILNNNVVQQPPPDLLVGSGDEYKIREDEVLKLRSQVSKLLCLRSQLDKGPTDACTNSPDFNKTQAWPSETRYSESSSSTDDENCRTRKSVSFAACPKEGVQTRLHTPPNSPAESLFAKPVHQCGNIKDITPLWMQQKTALVVAVTEAVEQLGEAFVSEKYTEEVAHVTLKFLCPALYALLSDGLNPQLGTLFGPVPNSVWKLVEASAQQGPITKALSDLTLRLDSEELLAEGPMKFNAFIFGLLNIGSLGAWLSFLRTREQVLHKHYLSGSLLYEANTSFRSLFDQLLASIQTLERLQFRLPILLESQILQESLRQIEQRYLSSGSRQQIASNNAPSGELRRWNSQLSTICAQVPLRRAMSDEVQFTKTRRRPWSYAGSFSINNYKAGLSKAIQGPSDEEYTTDSLEQPLVRQLQPGKREVITSSTSSDEDRVKFRRLQMQWEMLSGKDSSTNITRSRIPRPVSYHQRTTYQDNATESEEHRKPPRPRSMIEPRSRNMRGQTPASKRHSMPSRGDTHPQETSRIPFTQNTPGRSQPII